MNQTQTMTAPEIPGETDGGRLAAEIRRGERLLQHYRTQGRRAEASMIERDLSRARVAQHVGNGQWIAKAIEALVGYED